MGLGVLLSRTLTLDLSRGMVPIWEAQSCIGPLHRAGVDVCGSAVDGCGARLAGSDCTDGILQAGSGRVQHGWREREINTPTVIKNNYYEVIKYISKLCCL